MPACVVVQRGSAHHAARLTEEQVREIRQRYAGKRVTLLALAQEFGVTEGAIWRIVSGRTWKHI